MRLLRAKPSLTRVRDVRNDALLGSDRPLRALPSRDRARDLSRAWVLPLAFAALALGQFGRTAHAQGKAKAAEGDFSLGYPELLVEPKASKRLEREAALDLESRWAAHRAIQVSAATLLVASAVQLATLEPRAPGANPRYSGAVGLAVGAGWLGLTSALSLGYHPFSSGLEAVSKLPATTPAERLVRERYSEEALRDAARAGKRLSWFSFLTQAGASAFLLAEASNGTAGKAAAGASLAVSLAPLIFQHPWIRPAGLQEQYKKKVYGPLVQGAMLTPVSGRGAVPGLLATLRF
jgi:hypothetical protein